MTLVKTGPKFIHQDLPNDNLKALFLFSGGEIKFYINGEQLGATQTLSNFLLRIMHHTHIGRFQSTYSTAYFGGIELYNQVIGAEGIEKLFKLGHRTWCLEY